MKAVFFTQHGAPDVLQYGELPTPEPGSGEVLVRLNAAGLNRLDLWVRNGWPGIKISYPHICGADGAGEIATVGAGAPPERIGQKVVINSNLSCGQCDYCLSGFDNRCRTWGLLGETRNGTYAEYVVVPAVNAYPLPDGFDDHLAAAAGLVYHTAWHSLIHRANLRAGEKVLVVGASGGVNTASIQIAKLAGATVYVVGSNPKKLELARSLGADFLIDRSTDENWSRMVYQLTEKQGVDVIVDNVGTTFPSSFRAAAKGARILTVGNTGGTQFEIDNRFIFAKHLTIIGSTMGTHQDFATVMNLIYQGKLTPAVDRTFLLAEARAAQAYLENGQQLGKVTLQVSP